MSRLFRSVLGAVLIKAVLLAPSLPASAASSAVVKGTVVDFSGKAIKKVAVVLTGTDAPSIRRTAKSDKNGHFELAVEDGALSYQVQFEKNGYVAMVASVEFTVGEVSERTFTMLTEQEIAEGKAEILRRRENPGEFAAMDRYKEGFEAFDAGDVATARVHFEAALEHNPSMIQALTAMCVISMQRQEWTGAAKYATRTLTIEPTSAVALAASYRANKSLGNRAEAAAAAAILKSTGSSGEVAGQIFNEGVDLYRNNEVENAVQLFEQAAELDPTLTSAHVALAGLYLNKGEFDKALAASDRALALDPSNKSALKYRFEACLRGGNDKLFEAIDALGAVNYPYVSQAVNEYAFNLFEGNQYDQSEILVEQLLAINPEDARANYVMGLILVNAGDNDAAQRHLQAFVDAAPDDPDAAGALRMIEAIR